MTEEMPRDRIKNPSINWPESEEEAFQAVLHSARTTMLGGHSRGFLLRNYTTNAGLGTTRSQQQADWLNTQQDLIRSAFEDFLDRLDLQFRTTSDATTEGED